MNVIIPPKVGDPAAARDCTEGQLQQDYTSETSVGQLGRGPHLDSLSAPHPPPVRNNNAPQGWGQDKRGRRALPPSVGRAE